MKWIPVSERLPKKTGDYLVWFQEKQAILPFVSGYWRWGDGSNMQEDKRGDVNHWMPLPEPPKEQEK
jgi:hypothetical protein